MMLGVARGISYGLWGPPDEFVPQARDLGAGLVRAYVYWGQVERRPGEYDWSAVDALLAQADDVEIWLTVCASSTWATRQPTEFLPPSPPNDLAQYGEFVRRLVERCAGRVTYWQCENEPSNTGLLWAGTAAEYVALLKTMRAAVDGTMVLGGCGYDVLSSQPGSEPRQFFDHVLKEGRDCFDLFSVNLYGDPAAIPGYLADVRAMLGEHQKPLVAGEIGGPVPFEYPEVLPAIQQAMAQGGSERDAMVALYAADLPDQLRMFLADCPPELAAKRDRIACRQLVTRTLLALAGGVQRTCYWHLAPETPGEIDPYQFMGLMFGKLNLLAYEGRELTRRTPAADTFALLASQLAGATGVTTVDEHAVRIEKDDPVLVVWATGEELPWHAPTANAVDVFGKPAPIVLRNGKIQVRRSDTPVFITV